MNNKPTRFERKTPEARRHQLIEAAIHCLARGGMSGFTIEHICSQAGVSRGLINHHFGGKEDLLVCAYESMTEYLSKSSRPPCPGQEPAAEEELTWIVESSFDQKTFSSSQLRAWLAVWGEVASNPRLKTLHRQRYGALKTILAGAIDTIAGKRKIVIDSDQLARLLIAALDGLWLEHCLDPRALSLGQAKEDCYRLIEATLGPIR